MSLGVLGGSLGDPWGVSGNPWGVLGGSLGSLGSLAQIPWGGLKILGALGVLEGGFL